MLCPLATYVCVSKHEVQRIKKSLISNELPWLQETPALTMRANILLVDLTVKGSTKPHV